MFSRAPDICVLVSSNRAWTRVFALPAFAALLISAWDIPTASAQKIAVADVTSAAEHADQAAGLTIVLRTYVGGKSQRVSRAELAAGVAKVGAISPQLLAVTPGKIAAALEGFRGRKWLASELVLSGPAFELRLVAYDNDGRQVGAKVVKAPIGDYDELVKGSVDAANTLVGAVALKRPRPGAFASVADAGRAGFELSSGDNTAAAKSLAAAPLRLGFELQAIRGVASVVIADDSVPLDLRMNAALVAGDLAAAKALAEKHADDPRGMALAARIKMTQLDHRAAKKILAGAKRSDLPFVVLAHAEYAAELGENKALASHFAQLLEGQPYIPALAKAAQLRPGKLGKRTEKALLAAAGRVAKKWPHLASRIAARALRGGSKDAAIFTLIDPFTISAAELKELKVAIEGLEDERLKARLGGEIAAREGDLETARKLSRLVVNLDPKNARGLALAAMLDNTRIARPVGSGKDEPEPDRATAGKMTLADEKAAAKLKHLADDLGPILAAFPSLAKVSGKVVLAPKTGSKELPFWPTRVHPERLRDGLEAALADAPYRLLTAVEVGEMAEKPTRKELAELATSYQASAVLIYGVRTDGFDATVSMLLYSAEAGTSEVFTDTLEDADEHGVVSWNPFFVITSLSIAGLLLLWLIWLVVRGTGTVRVELKSDPAAERPAFSILISRRNRCPVVTDPKMHIANVNAAEKVSRFSAHNVGAHSEFERIPPGAWYVHVFGTYEKAGETRCLPAISEGTRVKRSRVSVVNIDLIPKESEFHILISGEGGPAAGAQLWLSTEPAKRYAADPTGKAVIFAKPGDHVLYVSFRGLEVTRKLTAYGSKVSTIHLNLVRERRLAEVAEGLELDLDHDQEGEALPTARTAAFPHLSEETPTPRPSPLTPSQDGAENTVTGLQRYRAGERLGHGAMGVVYRAVDQVLDRQVALKVMSSELRENPKAAKMFEQEAKALASLNHPNVVTVFDQGRDGDEIFMVMELVEGRTLEQVLESRGKLPVSDAALVGEQLGRSLSYAHSRRVVHRDVKPGNVFITKDGTVKLGDFGLARVLKEVQIKKTEIKGTPLYMAPEQIRGSDIDFRADIYALGCTMYEVLAGRPPFIDGEILWHHIYTEPDPLSKYVQVPPQIEQLIMKCIAKEKSERIASADRISEVFGAFRRSARR